MAFTKRDPFGLGDTAWYAANYHNFPKVTLPDGQVLYQIPNEPGYVYDPVASRARGNAVFRANPQQQITDQQTAKDAQDAAIKQQQYNASPAGQLTPVVAGTAGTIGSLYAAKQFGLLGGNSALATVAPKVVGAAASTQAVTNSGAASTSVPVVSNVAPTTIPSAASDSSSVFSGAQASGQEGIANDGLQGATDGGSFFSLPSTMPISNGLTFSNAISAAAAAKGAYDVYNGLQNGGAGLRTGLTETGAGIGNMVAGPLGGAIGAIGGNILGYGYQGNGIKNHIALAAVAPPLEVARLLGFDPIHKTTRQIAQDHTADLLGQNKNDKVYQDYVTQQRAGYAAPPPDKSHPFDAGKYATWEDYKAAGLDANDLSGVYGNIKTYGPKWAALTPDQRTAVTQANINSGLYDSNKGEVEINNEDLAHKNFDSVVSGNIVPTAPTTPAQAAATGATRQPVVVNNKIPIPANVVAPLVPAPVVSPTLPPGTQLWNGAADAAGGFQAALTDNTRTVTRSPGIGLNGQRIVYTR